MALQQNHFLSHRQFDSDLGLPDVLWYMEAMAFLPMIQESLEKFLHTQSQWSVRRVPILLSLLLAICHHQKRFLSQLWHVSQVWSMSPTYLLLYSLEEGLLNEHQYLVFLHINERAELVYYSWLAHHQGVILQWFHGNACLPFLQFSDPKQVNENDRGLLMVFVRSTLPASQNQNLLLLTYRHSLSIMCFIILSCFSFCWQKTNSYKYIVY